ncbi:MAG TPA: TadE/TadG family type IV pilus assembly protein [Terracidiphilus sp.]|jgi:hypothetical protein
MRFTLRTRIGEENGHAPELTELSFSASAPHSEEEYSAGSRLASTEGAAMVEMALTVPIVFMLLLGMFSLSMALYQKLALAEAVSVGGRFLAIDRGDNDPCTSTTSKITAAAPGLTSSKMGFTYTLNGVKTTGTGCAGSSGSANANMISGANAQISVTYPCVLNWFPAFGNVSSTTCSLQSQIVEVIQ